MSALPTLHLGPFPPDLCAPLGEIKEAEGIASVQHVGYDEARIDSETLSVAVDDGDPYAAQDIYEAIPQKFWPGSDAAAYGKIEMPIHGVGLAWWGAKKWKVTRYLEYVGATVVFPSRDASKTGFPPYEITTPDWDPAFPSRYLPPSAEYFWAYSGPAFGSPLAQWEDQMYTARRMTASEWAAVYAAQSETGTPISKWAVVNLSDRESAGFVEPEFASSWHKCDFLGVPGEHVRWVTKYPLDATTHATTNDTANATTANATMSNEMSRVVPFARGGDSETYNAGIVAAEVALVVKKHFYPYDNTGLEDEIAAFAIDYAANVRATEDDPRSEEDLISRGAFAYALGYGPYPSYEIGKHDAIPTRRLGQALTMWGDDFLLGIGGTASPETVFVGAKLQLFRMSFCAGLPGNDPTQTPSQIQYDPAGTGAVALYLQKDIVSPIGFSKAQALRLLPEVFEVSFQAPYTHMSQSFNWAFNGILTITHDTETGEPNGWELNRDNRDDLQAAYPGASPGGEFDSVPATLCGYLKEQLIDSMGKVGDFWITRNTSFSIPVGDPLTLGKCDIWGPTAILNFDVQFAADEI